MKPFLENQGDLATRPSTADFAIVPSRSEGFGLTALEALFAGRTFLVTQTNGFGETVQNVLLQSNPWAVQILRNHISGLRLLKVSANQQIIRKSYGKNYILESQCKDLVEKMVSLASGKHLSVYLL